MGHVTLITHPNFPFCVSKGAEWVWVHIPSTLLTVCAFALWTDGIKRFSVYSYRLCVLGPKLALFTRGASQLRVRSCADVLRQSCKQRTAGTRAYKCAVGILWVIHWPATCHSWLWLLVVVGTQNYKSKQVQMDVVNSNTIPEKSNFNSGPTQQALLKHINTFIHFIFNTILVLLEQTWIDIFLPYTLSRRLNNVQITSLKVTVMQIHRLKQSIYSS